MLADASLTSEHRAANAAAACDGAPIVWCVPAHPAIPIHEALAVAEALHVAVLSLAGRHFGADAIPSVLSGRGQDGRPLHGVDQHRHKHVLIGTDGTAAIGSVAIWAPVGFTREERAVVADARLRWDRRFVALALDPDGSHPSFAVARSWKSLTPYLPFNHVKSRGRNSVEGQLRRELVEFRALGEPLTVTARPWARGPFRLSRGDGRSAGPPPRPFDVEVTFAEPVAGPVVLGRHAHFSLGLMIPNDV